MSYQTLYYEVYIRKEEILDLFLGEGNLKMCLQGDKQITINEFFDQHFFHEVAGVRIHEAKIHGTSEDPNLSRVGGKVTIASSKPFQSYKCTFVLHLRKE